MEEGKTIFEKIKNLSLQEYLSLSYAFLLVIGLFYQTIFYSFLGINILDYSSVLDVLLSPISLMTGNVLLIIAFIVLIGIVLLYLKFLPKYYSRLAKKEKYQSGKKKEKLEKAIASINQEGKMKFILFCLFAVFIGLSIGGGTKLKSRLNKKNIKLTHELIFKDGERQVIKMIGKNSLYVFYVTQEKREVICAPIESNIKMISKLNKY